MLRSIILCLLVAGGLCEWSLSGIINPTRRERRVVPQHDYTTSATELERFFNQLELFSPLSHLTTSFPMDIRESAGNV
jgi:hypothetical protein